MTTRKNTTNPSNTGKTHRTRTVSINDELALKRAPSLTRPLSFATIKALRLLSFYFTANSFAVREGPCNFVDDDCWLWWQDLNLRASVIRLTFLFVRQNYRPNATKNTRIIAATEYHVIPY